MKFKNEKILEISNIRRTISKIRKAVLLISYFLFAIAGCFMIFKAENPKTLWAGVTTLLLFTCGGIVTFFPERKKGKKIRDEEVITIVENRKRMILPLVASLIFVFAGYIMLPFNDIFGNSWFLYIVGGMSILFFGSGFVVIVIRLVNPRIVIQILGNGIIIPFGIKKQLSIPWDEIIDILYTDYYVSIYLINPSKYPVNKIINSINLSYTGTNINIGTHAIEYSSEELANFLYKKVIDKSPETYCGYHEMLDEERCCK